MSGSRSLRLGEVLDFCSSKALLRDTPRRAQGSPGPRVRVDAVGTVPLPGVPVALASGLTPRSWRRAAAPVGRCGVPGRLAELLRRDGKEENNPPIGNAGIVLASRHRIYPTTAARQIETGSGYIC
jgi:hypothetical protein